MTDYESRFGGVARLFGAAGLNRLRAAHVCVVGVGGVGSWAVEALARSGVGRLTLVDLDEVCVSNVNRQLHAMDGEIGKAKVEVLAARVRAINPHAAVHPVSAFFTETTAAEILATPFDFVLDAIDSPSKKALLIARCREQGIPVVTSGGAGSRHDPTQVRVADLAESTHDRLLQQVRSLLRKRHGFPRERRPFGVPCVFSPELATAPSRVGESCDPFQSADGEPRNCDSGHGTATFVTGTFGFVAASVIVNRLAGG